MKTKLRVTYLIAILGSLCAAILVPARADRPATWRLERHHDRAHEPDPQDYLVQIGVRVVQRPDRCLYVYTVANRSNDTLTTIQIGYDVVTERCELTGAPPHAPPDTAYSPVGWQSAPVQMKRKDKTFAVEWKVARGLENTGGIPPNVSISGFTVVLPERDPLYETCHFRAPFKSLPFMSSIGRLMPEAEMDIPISATGTVLGVVTNALGAAMPYANIIIKGTQLGGRTSADGSYFITKVPVGRYTLSARSMGFTPRDQDHVRVRENASTKVDFELTKAPPYAPCVPYVTATGRITVPFPGDAVDTRHARFLERSERIPAKQPGKDSKPQLYIYSNTAQEISLAYSGVGQDTTRRAFVATVHRNFSNIDEERLICIAEETYPPLESVLSVADSRRDTLTKEKRLWWYGAFDGVRLPYAVTLDAVRYYLKLTQALGRGDSSQTGGIRMKSSEFSYHANVSPLNPTYSRDGRVFHDVYVVEMGLK